MFARLAIYRVPDGRASDARVSFRAALERIAECPGSRDAYLLLDDESGRAVTVTVWEDRAAMTDSRVLATRLRSEAAAAAGVAVVSVDEFEVVRPRDDGAY